MRSSVYFMAGTLLVAVGWYAYNENAAWQKRHAEAAAGEQEARLNRIEQELAELRRANAKTTIGGIVSEQTMALGGTPDGPAGEKRTAARATASPAANSASPTAAPSRTRTAEDARDAVEVRFIGERKDPDWSRGAQNDVREVLVPKLPSESRLLGLECRETVCRAETSHPNREAYQKFMQEALMPPDPSWLGPKMVSILREESTGDVVSVMYLGRGWKPLVQDGD